MRNKSDVTKRVTYFIRITPHVRILYGIEGIPHGKRDLRDDVVSKKNQVF